jgi:hypothetical protein
MMITYIHCKMLNYCDRGIRLFLENRGLSFNDFVANGYPVEIARTWNDLMVNRLIKIVEAENGNR